MAYEDYYDFYKIFRGLTSNTANPKPTYGDGTDCAIYETAGKKKLLIERKKIGDISQEKAIVTLAFNLNTKNMF